jgi:hypothetical protein
MIAAARACKHCGCWPCRCGVEPDAGDMPPFALRIERCACNGPAIAAGGEPRNVFAAVRAHNATPEHESWRTRREGSA